MNSCRVQCVLQCCSRVNQFDIDGGLDGTGRVILNVKPLQ